MNAYPEDMDFDASADAISRKIFDAKPVVGGTPIIERAEIVKNALVHGIFLPKPSKYRMSSSFNRWKNPPTDMKRQHFIIAWFRM